MEKSKLISLVIARFKVAYPYYFKELTENEFTGLFSVYQEELGNCNPIALLKTTKKIIRNNKFMPTIAEILSEYKEILTQYYIDIIRNSNVPNKKFLLDMIDWYSLQDDFPENLPQNIVNDISKIDYQNIKELDYKEAS